MADLREQLSEALNNVTNSEEQAPNPGAGPDAPVEPEATPAASDPKAGRTAGRPRDEKGRLLPGKPQKDSAQEPGREATPTQPEPAATETPAAETKPRPARPSSWKKEYWDHWEKIDPTLAEYLVQRESEYAKGVSTYKTEADNARGYIDAVAPYLPALQRFGLDPAAHIGALMSAHQALALGSPEQKLAMFQKLANDYQVPLQSLFVQGQDGQIYFNPRLQQQPTINPQQIVQQIQQQTEQRFQQYVSEQNVASFQSAKDAQGNPKYPHFEQVREAMAQLLESRLADDLEGAYNAALRLPQHSNIFDAMQKQQREADEKRKREEAARAAQRARQNAVSTKTATPTGAVQESGAKGRRAALEEAFELHSGGGRV